jgi:hypothetical protein
VNRSRLAEIRARRERLVAKAGAQREEVALLLAPWRGPLHMADRGLAAAEYIRAHPGIVVVAAAALVILSPRRAFRWARRAYAVWRGYRWTVKALNQASAIRRTPPERGLYRSQS